VTSWRSILPVHPAAEAFDLLSADELKKLGEDIKRNGLQAPVVLDDRRRHLLDGRNRLDAMEKIGIEIVSADGTLKVPTVTAPPGTDPYAFVASANLHRRHLSHEEKSKAAGKLLEANPEASNRQIAEQVGFDHKTVGAIRRKKEERGEIPHVTAVKDKAGRRQPTKRRLSVARELERIRAKVRAEALSREQPEQASAPQSVQHTAETPVEPRQIDLAGFEPDLETPSSDDGLNASQLKAQNKRLRAKLKTLRKRIAQLETLLEEEKARVSAMIVAERQRYSVQAIEQAFWGLFEDDQKELLHRIGRDAIISSAPASEPEPEAEPAPAPRKRGRPKGSRNRPKDDAAGDPIEVPTPRRRGRPPGSRNKPKGLAP
jgi:hypothetical protein